MEAAAKMIFEIGDQHKPAIMFRGRKRSKAIINGYPIRVHEVSLKAFDQGAPILRKGKEATPAEVAEYFLERAVTHGITLTAKRLLESVLTKTEVDPDQVDGLSDNETDVESAAKEGEATKQSARDMLTDRSPEIKGFVAPKKKDPKPAKVKEPKPPKVQAEKGAPGAAPSVVAAICAEFKIEPKDARKKLRAAGLSAPYIDVDKIRAVLAPK